MTTLNHRFEKSAGKSRLGIWAMILILTLFPGYILYQNWSPEGDVITSERFLMQKWLAETELDVKMLLEASREDFWAYESGMLFKKNAESLSGRLDKKKLLETCLSSIARKGFAHNPGAIVWTADTETSRVELQSSIELTSSFMFRQLFLQMALQKKNGSSELTDRKWFQRLRTMFGEMAYSEIFMPDEAEKVYPVMFNKQTGLLVWDFLDFGDDKSKISGFILFIPLEVVKKTFNAGRIWKNWHRIKKHDFAGVSTWPVFVFPESDGRLTAQIPYELRYRVDHSALKDFIDKNFKVESGLDLVDFKKIPSGLMGKSFYIGNHLGRLCHLTPELGGFAILLSEVPENEAVLRLQVSRIYLQLLVFVWSLFLIRLAIFRQLPHLSVRFQVMAWFLAVAAFPVTLTIGAWTAVMQDFYQQKVLLLQRDLHKLAINVDNDVAVLSQKFLHASRRAVRIPGLHQKVFRLPSEPDLNLQVFDDVIKSYLSDGIRPLGAVLVVQGGWFFSRFSEDAPDRMQKSVKFLVGAVLNNFLEQADPSLYKRLSPPEGKGYGSYRVNALAGISGFNVYSNFTGFRNRFDNVTDFLSGAKYSQQFYYQINIGDAPFAVFVAIWSPENFYRRVLRESLPVNALKLRQTTGVFPDIAVYKGEGNSLRLVESCGRVADLESVAKYSSDKSTGMMSENSVTVFTPSKKMSGHTIVVRASLDRVFLQVAYEKMWLAITLLLTVLSILAGSWWLAMWISRPLRQLVPALSAIRLRKKSQAARLKRTDEIGVMAETVDRMFAWVRERESLVKFVAPQAVEAVASGNLFQAGIGTNRKAIVMVSDVRSFTTLSEEYPAEQIFDMVNHHLAEMSRVIKSKGGVIDRFVGDAVWAIFYEDDKNMAEPAIRAAFDMMTKHREIQAHRAALGLFQVKTGVGLVRGSVLAGIMGSSGVKLDYSVAGAALYRAEETESASKLSKFSDVIIDASLMENAIELGFMLSAIEDSPGHFELIAPDGDSYA